MQDESSQPEPIVMGIEHVEAANPERVVAALRRLVSHLAASDPDDQEPADVIMVAMRRRYGDQVRDQIASNFEPQEGSGVFRGTEVRAEGEQVTDVIVSQDAEGTTKPVQRVDGEWPVALHGSLYRGGCGARASAAAAPDSSCSSATLYGAGSGRRIKVGSTFAPSWHPGQVMRTARRQRSSVSVP